MPGRPASSAGGADRLFAIEPSIRTVLDVEAFALRTGITGDQAQALIDRTGNDRVAIEQAARELKKS